MVYNFLPALKGLNKLYTTIERVNRRRSVPCVLRTIGVLSVPPKNSIKIIKNIIRLVVLKYKKDGVTYG